jgi:hypothetical protein
MYINTDILITEMAVSNEAKKVIPLKFLRKIILFSSCEFNPRTYCRYEYTYIILFQNMFTFL